MQERYNKLREMVEGELERAFLTELPQKRLLESMRYSLLAGGKRLRPILTMEFCRICGRAKNWTNVLPVAAAVEMVHTYTLIHDDLPCMDDDDLRRGRPTNHKAYGEATAILAGDALLATAFRYVLGADIGDGHARRAAKALADAAGELGVCGGQILDLEGESGFRSEEEIINVYSLKTSALFKAAAVMGVLAGRATESQIEAAGIFGENLGLAFQIRDDILDEVGNEGELGKTVGSDRDSSKSTLLALIGQERCGELIGEKTAIALSALRSQFHNTEFLEWIAGWLTERSN